MIIQVNFPNKVIVYNKEQMMHRVNECFCGCCSKNDEQIGTFCLFKQFGNDDAPIYDLLSESASAPPIKGRRVMSAPAERRPASNHVSDVWDQVEHFENDSNLL